MSDRNQESQTIYFDSVTEEPISEVKTNNIKPKLIIGIFSVIILILLSFIILIFGQIFSKTPDNGNGGDIVPPVDNFTSLPVDIGQVHVGNLLLVNKNYEYNYELNKDKEMTALHANDMYSLVYGDGRIILSTEALDAFNKMIVAYCEVTSPVTDKNKSNLNVAWGYSDEATLKEDVSGISPSFYDNATGNTLTLRRTSDSQAITEDILISDYAWIYENMYKYGFVIRYPNAKVDSTGIDSTKRIHLRYVGYEHAYYMHENDLCLEEYLAKLRTDYKYDSSHLTFKADNDVSYEIYYVKGEGETISVPVPKEGNYTISGDNMNGFIVTITK